MLCCGWKAQDRTVPPPPVARICICMQARCGCSWHGRKSRHQARSGYASSSSLSENQGPSSSSRMRSCVDRCCKVMLPRESGEVQRLDGLARVGLGRLFRLDMQPVSTTTARQAAQASCSTFETLSQLAPARTPPMHADPLFSFAAPDLAARVHQPPGQPHHHSARRPPPILPSRIRRAHVRAGSARPRLYQDSLTATLFFVQPCAHHRVNTPVATPLRPPQPVCA
jgi:hypothetical protein